MGELVMMEDGVHVILFKTTDLRLHDHAALLAAHAAAGPRGRVLHVLALDSRLGFGPSAPLSREAKIERIDGKRGTFLVESVAALHEALETRGYELLCHGGRTEDAVGAIRAAVPIAQVHCHGPELCSEERGIERRLAAPDLKLHWNWTLTHVDDLPPKMRRGEATPDRFKPFLQAVQKGKGPARYRCSRPEPTWDALDAAPDVRAASRLRAWAPPTSAADVCRAGACRARVSPGPPREGGEARALAALEAYVWGPEARAAHYVGSSDSMTPGPLNALNATTREGKGRDVGHLRTAPLSVVFRSFRLIFRRAIVSGNDFDAFEHPR